MCFVCFPDTIFSTFHNALFFCPTALCEGHNCICDSEAARNVHSTFSLSVLITQCVRRDDDRGLHSAEFVIVAQMDDRNANGGEGREIFRFDFCLFSFACFLKKQNSLNLIFLRVDDQDVQEMSSLKSVFKLGNHLVIHRKELSSNKFDQFAQNITKFFPNLQELFVFEGNTRFRVVITTLIMTWKNINKLIITLPHITQDPTNSNNAFFKARIPSEVPEFWFSKLENIHFSSDEVDFYSRMLFFVKKLRLVNDQNLRSFGFFYFVSFLFKISFSSFSKPKLFFVLSLEKFFSLSLDKEKTLSLSLSLKITSGPKL